MDTTPIGTILEWMFYGAVRYVLLWIPGLTPFVVDRGAPWQWFRYCSWTDWFHYNDNNGGPDEHWLRCWFRMALGELTVLAVEESKGYVRSVRDSLVGLIGGIRSSFNSLGSWLAWLNDLVGDYLPYFAPNVVTGLMWLRDRFPAGIVQGWATWTSLWESVKASVRDWAMARYDAARAWVDWLVEWITGIGEAIRQWVARNAAMVDDLRSDAYGFIVRQLGWAWDWLAAFAADPAGWVLSLLGDDWPRLLTFIRDCGSFYYNLWASGWRTLAEIVDDPRGWLMDRLESALLDRW